jgi:hypothetical protein
MSTERYRYPRADRDARPGEELTFYVTDRECGIRDDPSMCMFAQSAMRAFDTDTVWFGRSRAYVEVNHEVLRYFYAPDTYEAVRHYDATGEMAAGIYKIVPPPPSATLEGLRARNQRESYKETGTHPQRGNRKRVWMPHRGWSKTSAPNPVNREADDGAD